MNYLFDTGTIEICFKFIFDETEEYFGNYIVPTNKDADIFATKEELIQNPYGFKHHKIDAFSEFQNLMVKTGNYLLDYNACMFHGALIEWNGMGILFSAASGTGKTTQYRLWRNIDTTVRMINGDKPILEYRNNQIIAHSSPWNGKEKYGAAGISVPLKSIILLEQGIDNKIQHISGFDVVIPLFTQFIAYAHNTSILEKETFFLDKMLDAVPVWKLMNKGDIDSAVLTRSTLEAYYDL